MVPFLSQRDRGSPGWTINPLFSAGLLSIGLCLGGERGIRTPLKLNKINNLPIKCETNAKPIREGRGWASEGFLGWIGKRILSLSLR